MSHTHYSSYEHIVFSTKLREPWLNDTNSPPLFGYIAGIVRKLDCHAIAIGGHVNHVRIMVRRSNRILTSDLVKEIKRSATLWMKSNNHATAAFRWQEGYGAFSVSYWDVKHMAQYIKHQKEHHERMSGEDEYRKLLEIHGVEYEEQYLWD